MGMDFDSPDDAYEFYNRYAFLHAFGIRIFQTFRDKTTHDPYRKKYVCNKQGFKDLKSNSSAGHVKKRRRDLRTGCEAYLRISKSKGGKWLVDMFNDVHNHELTVTPTKVMKHRSHGKFHRSMACKSLATELGRSGLKPCQIKKVVNTVKSPLQNDVTSKQCADILAEQRKQYKGKEFYGLIKHFQDKLIEDPNLYFIVDLFDDGSPRNIFWADGRSRDSYIKFGDVVVFDVTYMTNKFKMPFSPFVGVNHHGQSILFGGALLENEKQETFEWLFQNFLKCMFNKYPQAIIIDQDKAIGNAIRVVFPNTRHRYCSWHIKKHEIEHLRALTVRYNDIEGLYKQWVKSNTAEEFETRWEFLCGKYNFESGSWIMEMYKQRKLWAKAYLKDCFFAGMTSSGRSESIHSFFDGYVNSKTMLNEFVIQYDKAVEARRAAEEDEDFKSINSKPVLSSVNPIEAKASSRYTRKLFDAFTKEWTEATFNLTHETVSKNLEEIIYKVGQLGIDKIYWRNVTFRLSQKIDVTCSCAKFETYGILCKHILYVLKKRHVETLPDHYILPRWTLDTRYKLDNSNIGLGNIHGENEVSALTLWCVQSNFRKAIEHARDSPFEIKKLNTILMKFLDEQSNRTKSKQVEITSQDSNVGSSQVNMMPQISIRDPLVHTNTKGRPKNATRIKSSLEAPKKRTCSYCQEKGHNITGCSKKKADAALKEREG
ncbi:protein FAR1-RELATED SEQUENCE 5-like [Helianthus annuus]|uniref:protein FAR1-RELATED SEQUENCE 5-like n=1 Tax=Helianthus annuus TaxID=4232 RepID=UPI000B8F36E3|nr:protein FAR1-RELATED SEQUENCE 5-like [Helianthus annuus]XP_035833765.1 protein FAR1-RELATED SEQUENCE 5-like [Helianthus annuus]